MSQRIIQDDKYQLLQDVKTVDWLINNTNVDFFDPTKFTGYQRKINDKHCDKIVRYIEENPFFLPTPIICAIDGEYSCDEELRIVDGQHRIEAFRRLKKKNFELYSRIKDKQIPVIILEKADKIVEIETFITINKTSKKVDTSLALVLKNAINYKEISNSKDLIKRDYLSVEVARLLNDSEESVWYNRISFEETPRKGEYQLISLNAFVRPTRLLIKNLYDNNLLKMNFNNNSNIKDEIQTLYNYINKTWGMIEKKWPEAFTNEESGIRIIQGPIGYSSLTKFFVRELRSHAFLTINSFEDYIRFIDNCLSNTNVEVSKWAPGEYYSQFTSESGYNLISKDLSNNCEMQKFN